MKQALIDPNTQISYVSGWQNINNIWQPIFTMIPNSARIAETQITPFPVAPPLFWTSCDDQVMADQWYYNTQTGEIIQIPPTPPRPEEAQPNVNGAQDV